MAVSSLTLAGTSGSSFRITLDNDGRQFDCDGSDTLLRAGLRAGLALPYECNSGNCGACQVEILSGKTRDSWPSAPGLSERARQRGRRLACQAQALSDCVIKARCRAGSRPNVRPARRKIWFASSRDIARDLSLFRFCSDAPADFLPGQYALLTLPGVQGDRAYSMCNLPNKQGDWAFLIKRSPAGAGSRALFETLRPGKALELDGPYGHAFLNTDTERDIVCIGGGSGISPLLSILASAANDADRSESQLSFYYGARTRQDLFIAEFLDEIGIPSGRIRLQTCLSAEISDSNWPGPRGQIHELLANELAVRKDPRSADYYFCGPPSMIDAVNRLLLIDNKLPSRHLHFDRFF